MSQSSQEFLDDFAAEAREHLASAGADLLALEKNPKDDTKNRLDRLFRGMHSIKGGAAFLGLGPVEKLAHALESLLDQVRQGKKSADGPLVDLALRGTDKLQALLDDLGHADMAMVAGLLEEVEKQTKSPAKASRKVATPPPTMANASPPPPSQPPTPPVPVAPVAPVAPVIAHSPPATHQRESGDIGQDNGTGTSQTSGQDSQKATTVRISVDLLDRLMNLAGELVLVRNRALQLGDLKDQTGGTGEFRPLVQKLNTLTTDIQQTVLLTRLQPLGNLFGRYPRLVRNLARELEKDIDLEISGSEVEMDKAIIDLLADPLTHLVRNSCDHGIETPAERMAANKPGTGHLRLAAIPEGGLIRIELRDDGKGIDPARLKLKALEKGLKTQAELEGMSVSEVQSLIFHPGFSTAEKVTDVSGRGVGMDVVRSNVEMMGGTIRIESEPGRGTIVILRLPLTVAILPSMMIGVDGHRFALLQRDISELICLEDGKASTGGSGAILSKTHQGELLKLRENLLPVVRLAQVLGLESTQNGPTRQFAAILNSSMGSFCLLMDQLVSPAEIVVKRLPRVLRSLPIYCGATIMGDGRTALILDTEGLAKCGGVRAAKDKAGVPSSLSQMRETLVSNEGLVLETGGRLYFLPIAQARKLIPFSMGKMEFVEEDAFFWAEGIRHRLLSPESPVVQVEQEKDWHLAVLLRNTLEPTAIPVGRCIDSLAIHGKIEELSPPQGALVGTLPWNGKILRVLDTGRLSNRSTLS